MASRLPKVAGMKHLDMPKLPAAAQRDRWRQVTGLHQADHLGSVTGLSDTEVVHSRRDGDAYPTAARLVPTEGDAGLILEPGEQVLVIAPGVKPGVPFRRIDHASLWRGVDGATIGCECDTERG
jgi:hypothetical protein